MLKAVAVVAGKELFRKVILEAYDYVHRMTGRAIRDQATERQIDSLYRRASQVRKVKTIWQIDKAVDLKSFYCDSHILVQGKRKRILRMADFGLNGDILIEGIAGQGKSILLRHLCSVELSQGQYVPLFLELRRITRDSSLMDRIQHTLSTLGLPVDQDFFRSLAPSGKLLLLLDAFDEVPNDLKSKVLTDIEDLASRYENLRIIVTSRPNHNIQMSSHFTIVTLDNLQGGEYRQVIRKLATGQAWAQGLIGHIEHRAEHIKGLLCTPLMVTLLVISYKSFQKLPTKLSDFYDALFQTLLQRHDGTKPGYTRQRGCVLDDNEYRQVFETLCILLKKKGQQSFTTQSIYEVAKEAISLCGYKANAASYVDDIVKITCLIIRDGEEHRFIHKTVQEYYTASYIQRKPDAWVSEFYSRIDISRTHGMWQQELEFLAEIDTYRYNRHFYLPAILEFLDTTEADLDGQPLPISRQALGRMYAPMKIAVDSTTNLRRMRGFWKDCRPTFIQTSISDRLFTLLLVHQSELEAIRKMDHVQDEGSAELLQEGDRNGWHRGQGISFSLGKVLELGGLPSFMEHAQSEYLRLFEKARSIRDTLSQAENASLLDGLL